MTDTDTPALEDVPTADLVAEVMRRAPMCKACRIPMVVAKVRWYACPACSATRDYVTPNAPPVRPRPGLSRVNPPPWAAGQRPGVG